MKPVMHLAAAREAVSTTRKLRQRSTGKLAPMAWDEDAVRDLVWVAEYFEAEVVRIQRFEVAPGQQIRLRVKGWEMPPWFLDGDPRQGGT